MEALVKFIEVNIYKQKRKEQLDHEKILYERLALIKKDCPEVVVTLLLWRSQINREQFDEASNANIFNSLTVIDHHLDWINNYHTELDSATKDKNVCQRLKVIPDILNVVKN